MINVTIRDIIDGSDALSQLASSKLPAKAAYRAHKLLSQVTVELQRVDTVRSQKSGYYRELIEKGDMTEEEAATAFSADITALLSEDVSFEVLPVRLEDLSGANFTPAQMRWLEPFLDVGE